MTLATEANDGIRRDMAGFRVTPYNVPVGASRLITRRLTRWFRFGTAPKEARRQRPSRSRCGCTVKRADSGDVGGGRGSQWLQLRRDVEPRTIIALLGTRADLAPSSGINYRTHTAFFLALDQLVDPRVRKQDRCDIRLAMAAAPASVKWNEST